MKPDLGKIRLMRWNCDQDKDGCFNEKKRLKLGLFDACFPGMNSMSDIDGWIHYKGAHLFVEWKDGMAAPIGIQGDGLMALAKDPISVIFVDGDAETMEVNRFAIARNGVLGKVINGDYTILQRAMFKWVEHIQSHIDWVQAYDREELRRLKENDKSNAASFIRESFGNKFADELKEKL